MAAPTVEQKNKLASNRIAVDNSARCFILRLHTVKQLVESSCPLSLAARVAQNVAGSALYVTSCCCQRGEGRCTPSNLSDNCGLLLPSHSRSGVRCPTDVKAFRRWDTDSYVADDCLQKSMLSSWHVPCGCIADVNKSRRKSVMKNIKNEKGAIGWILLWALGIPIPILLILFMVRGCT